MRRAQLDRIEASATIDYLVWIGELIFDESVIAVSARKLIGPGPAIDDVVTTAAIDGVIAAKSFDYVGIGSAGKRVIAAGSGNIHLIDSPDLALFVTPEYDSK